MIMIKTTVSHLVAFEQKPKSADCGVAAVRSIFTSLTGVVLDEDALRERLGTTEEQGTRTKEIIRFFEEKGLVCEESENNSIESIKKELGEGKLCLVAYQAWGTEEEYQELESGHYSVIYGVDENDVYLLDPSIHEDEGMGLGKRKMRIDRFLDQWKDKNNRGRVYDRWCLSVGLK